MLKPFLRRLAAGEDLSRREAEEAMGLIMEGRATPAQIGAFALGLRMKGETVDEVAGCALAMRARVARVEAPRERLIDTCGTGGDGANTFNISTAAAFVAAAGGAVVAKHGNRAVSSRCGSADVMEELGVPLTASIPDLERCLSEAGIAFLFAPHHHAAMKHAAGPRKELGVRTVFNILGPLSNPALARRQLMGVYAPDLVPLMARVLLELGSVHALVVHSRDGLDEISIAAPTLVAELKDGRIETREVTPESAGLPTGSLAALAGGTPKENALLIRGILDGGVKGPARDVVLLNAGGSLLAAGVAGSLGEGVDLSREIVDSGKAAAKLDQLAALLGNPGPGPGGLP